MKNNNRGGGFGRSDGKKRPFRSGPKGGGFRSGPGGGGGFRPRGEGGFSGPKGGGFGPRKGGGNFRPRGEGGGFPPRAGGDNFRPRREGGFPPRPQGEGFRPRPGGDNFRPRREGGFPPRPQGEGFRPRPGGGNFGPRREGGFTPRPKGEGFRPRPGGDNFRPRREGGFTPRPKGEGFRPRPGGDSFRPPRRQDGYPPRVKGEGFPPRPGGDSFRPPREEGFTPRPEAENPEARPAAHTAPDTGPDDFVYGRHPVLALLTEDGNCRINKLWLLKGGSGGPFEEIVRAAEARRVVFQWVERERLDTMVRDGTHQGVVARVSEVGYGSLDDLLAAGTPTPLVLLDGIEDPHNVGAIIRSAAFFGAKGVVIPRWRSAGLSGTVMKASAGALSKMPLIQVTNIAQTLLELKEKGYWIYGADGSGGPVSSVVLNTPLALVIGAEGEGLHRLVKDRCDVVAAIPGSGDMESLNASCAAAVMLHEIFRRQKPAT